jgi:hypothetical protein
MYDTVCCMIPVSHSVLYAVYDNMIPGIHGKAYSTRVRRTICVELNLQYTTVCSYHTVSRTFYHTVYQYIYHIYNIYDTRSPIPQPRADRRLPFQLPDRATPQTEVTRARLL